jgi:hypothetical protein
VRAPIIRRVRLDPLEPTKHVAQSCAASHASAEALRIWDAIAAGAKAGGQMGFR